MIAHLITRAKFALPTGRIAALALTLLAAGCVTPAPEQDPTVQRLTELDGRLLRIERILTNQSLLEQSQRVEALYSEVRTLRGQIEQMQHAQENVRNQQRELYADLDKRLQMLETRNTASASVGATSGVTPTPAGTDDDATAYKKSFDLLKEGKYEEAVAAFSQFLSAYPQSNLADNAYYWLGEARYVGKDFAAALKSFRSVVDKFPDSRKLPDAWLKIGYCQYELKNYKEARDALKRVMQIAPDTATARLAEQRLAKMQAEGR
jgi:tol-pal system protein YbgF